MYGYFSGLQTSSLGRHQLNFRIVWYATLFRSSCLTMWWRKSTYIVINSRARGGTIPPPHGGAFEQKQERFLNAPEICVDQVENSISSFINCRKSLPSCFKRQRGIVWSGTTIAGLQQQRWLWNSNPQQRKGRQEMLVLQSKLFNDDWPQGPTSEMRQVTVLYHKVHPDIHQKQKHKS